MRFWAKYREEISGLIHLILFVIIFVLAFLFRFEFNIPESYKQLLIRSIGVVVLFKFLVFHLFKIYRGSWRYPSIYDLSNIIKASTISTMGVGLLIYLLYVRHGFPRSIVLMDWIMTIMIVGGVRFSIRLFREELSGLFTKSTDGKRVLIIGAGNAGESLVREIKKYPELHYQVVGFVDDNPAKIGSHLHGVKIYGPISSLPELAESLNVDEILIAIPSATGKQMRRIVQFCEEAGKPFRTMPSLDRLIDGRVTVSKLREVQIEDLLRREPVNLDTDAIEQFLTGRTVLVTGAGGSIGSELCRQIIRFGPKSLIMLERAETALFEIERELEQTTELPGRIIARVGDICDRRCLELIFSQYKPEVVFHCAAYKHVPLMEFNIREALKNNVLGTKILARTAEAFGVESFVFISTDKAVNPSSVMGASKRLAERYLQYISRFSRTRFIIVRFGNVLGSQGSVVEIFRRQIEQGGPITITHPDMKRYFMTIPEAAQLVLQASAIGKGGEVYFLDMGEPVKIIDLARDLIKLSGLKPDEDIEIVFTGIRPGEKLFEELRFEGEDMLQTSHNKIYQVRMNGEFSQDLEKELIMLEQELENSSNEDELKEILSRLVPEYRAWGGAEAKETRGGRMNG